MSTVEEPSGPYDLVVLGSGASGLTGALVAAIGGARVLVLEKSDLIGGTTSMSGGGVWVPCNRHMGEVGVDDNRDEALAYLRACAGPAGDDDHIVALVDHGPPMIELLEDEGGVAFEPWPSVGGTIDYRPWLPGAKHGGRALNTLRIPLSELGEWGAKLRKEAASRWRVNPLDYYSKEMHLMRPVLDSAGGGGWGAINALSLNATDEDEEAYGRGTGLVAHLLRGALNHGVHVRTGTPATRLVVESGRVVGVAVADGDGETEIEARHGVLVATGGFTNNEELKRLWLSRPLEFTCDVESNQGDGHLMGASIGAQLAGLGDAWWMPHLQLGSETGVVNAGGSREDRILPHTIIVNSTGRRFMNEATNYYDFGEHFGNRVGAAPRNFPAWFIFDQQGVERYALLAWKLPQAGQPAEFLKVGETIEDLATQLGVDPKALTDTIARFNTFARNGVDEEFQRGGNPWDLAWGDPENLPNPCLGTLEKGPFYAIQVLTGALATRGGLRVNARAEVLAAKDGQPIPGLYAAGNCSNGGPAGTYAGPGSTLGAGMTFGYIAAKQVTAGMEKP
jgi:3-oxosteroid 1-dehydrogenase